MKKIWKLLAAMLLFMASSGALAETQQFPVVETTIANIKKYGNVELSYPASQLLAAGYEYGDVITVGIEDQAVDMPLGSSYSDVESGNAVCRATMDDTEDLLVVAINMGDFASTYGIAVKTKIEEDPGYRWDYLMEEPVLITISMQEKGGYADGYMMHQLSRSNERADYPQLSDAQYANFRNIATTGMAEGMLYRSSSPINPDLNRSKEADEALNDAGIQTVINLADTEEGMQAYADYAASHYSERHVIALNLDMDFSTDDFRARLAEGFRFMAAHEGPYLIHCKEGQDRAGFVSALLECLMGATAHEVTADYMVTYYNYYGVEPGTEQYDRIVRANIVKSLAAAFAIDDLGQADLAACAEVYLRGIGLSDETIAALRQRLGQP